MADAAHEAADAAVEAWKAEVWAVYQEAQADAQEALSAFLKRFEKEDEKRRKLVEEGEMTKAEYKSWRSGQILRSRQLSSTLDQVSQAMTEANQVAMAALSGKLPEVYAENANYSAFWVCKETGLAVGFDLVDVETVQHMLTAGEAVLMLPSVNVAKDMAWNRKLMASQLTQGVLLGEPIPKMARRVQRVTGSNYATAVRTARTTVTGAENAGRVHSYKRAKEMGIKLEKEWVATRDNRTRHSHRKLDGQKIPNEEGAKFDNGCRFPGDPQGRYDEICNCRCTLVAAIEGVDTSDAERWSRLPEGMTYEEWKAGGSGKKSAGGTAVSEGERAKSATRQSPQADVPMKRKADSANPQKRASVKPVNEHLYNSQKNYVERHGGTIIRGGSDIEKHLDEMEADASNIGDVILLREDASTSEVLEEVFHFKQHKRGDYADADEQEMTVRREIDAQRYLLSVAKRYHIPESETEQTKMALAEYERRLDSIEGGKE